jgi:hypothetical protein
MDARQNLYQALAEQIWNPENLLREADAWSPISNPIPRWKSPSSN